MRKCSFCSVLLLLCVLSATALAQTFRGAVVQPASGTPFPIAAADFNHDGRPDVVYQDSSTGGSLHVMIGNGDGTFREVQQIAVPLDVGGHLTAADVTGDGYPDIIVGYYGFDSNSTPDEITVLINQRDGTFGSPIFNRFSSTVGPESVVDDLAVADVDGDGHADLLFAAAGGLMLMRGDGAGHFTSTVVATSAMDDLNDVFVADFNGDGRPDIAVNGIFGIYTLLNTGNGTFGPTQSVATILMNPPTGFAVADLNGDGRPDLLYGGNGSLWAAYGKGDGTFQAPVVRGSAPPAAKPSILAVADVNGDGLVDVVTQNVAGPVVDLQLPGGRFSYNNSSGPAVGDRGLLAPVFADFDGDGIGDIVSGATGALIFSKGHSDGTFSGGNATITYGDTLDLQTADFNRDGKPDVTVLTGGGSLYGDLSVYVGDGTGHFSQTAALFDYPKYAGQSTVADLNRDGIPDVFNAGYVLYGDGRGGFASVSQIAAPQQGDRVDGYTAIADFNEDGFPDAVTTTVSFGGLYNPGLAVGLSTGPNAWKTSLVALPVVPRPVYGGFNDVAGPLVAADFNHDGHADLATASSAGIYIYSGDGKGNLALVQTLSVGSYLPAYTGAIKYSWTDLEGADLDGDGNLDLLLPIADQNLLLIYYGRADGTFDAAIKLPTSQDVRFVTVRDMNADGIPDLILSGHALVRILHGLGGRTYEATPAMFAANPYPQKVRVADVNGDGNPDLLVPNGGYSAILEPGQTFTVLLNGATPLAPNVLSAAVTCTPEPSALAQVFSCTASFRPVANTALPTGSIAFLLDGAPAGNGVLSAQQATMMFPATIAAGTHTIEADFAGDANFLATRATTVHVIAKAVPSLVLSGPAHVPFGQTVNLVTTASGSTGNPTGIIILTDSGTTLTQQALASGMANYATTLAAGPHTLQATYGGDSSYNAAVSNTLSLVVDGQPTQTVLTANPLTAPFGTTVALSATVSTTPGIVSGTVTFFDGASAIGTATLGANGTATLQTATLALGPHSLTAGFNVSTAFAASTSAPVAVVITGVGTSTTLTSTPNPSYLNQSVTFAATVTQSAAQTLSGQVRFMDGAAVLGDSTLNAAGLATLTTSTLTVGTHPVTAQYLGNGILVPSQSQAVQQVVLNSSFTLTSPPSLTVQTQHHMTFDMAVTPVGQFSGPVVLSCGSIPAHATCWLSTGTVNLGPAGGAQTVHVYFDTSDVIGYASNRRPSAPGGLAKTALAAVFAPALLYFASKRRRGMLRSLRLVACVLCSLTALLLLGGCSGMYPASVAPGQYTIHFTGVSASPAITRSSDTQITVSR